MTLMRRLPRKRREEKGKEHCPRLENIIGIRGYCSELHLLKK
jgi:hypothetical protein